MPIKQLTFNHPVAKALEELFHFMEEKDICFYLWNNIVEMKYDGKYYRLSDYEEKYYHSNNYPIRTIPPNVEYKLVYNDTSNDCNIETN